VNTGIETEILENGSKRITSKEYRDAFAKLPPETFYAMEKLPVVFFTIVRNGMPFITHHLEVFKRLPFRWTWHIIEGIADLKHDTAWSVPAGGRAPIPGADDGTMRYIAGIQGLHGENGRVRVSSKCCGKKWDGKIEMVREPLKWINEPCLLFEVDNDECWTPEQITAVRQMFLAYPTRTAAYFKCWYFVGPDIVTTSLNTYGNNLGYEWLRVWNYQPGDHWVSHEPPVLARNGMDLAKMRPFTHAETDLIGRFQHFAYATEKQAAFKRDYYGYKNAVEGWKGLQENKFFPTRLRNFFDWVRDEAMVDKASKVGVVPLIKC
jgi:hypothetical protein